MKRADGGVVLSPYEARIAGETLGDAILRLVRYRRAARFALGALAGFAVALIVRVAMDE